MSLREDYIGILWDWQHKYKLEAAWLHQYRIKRFDDEKAYEIITEPLFKLGIKVDTSFIKQLITELKIIGDGLIYPPYLQIVCSKLYEEYKNQNTTERPSIEFGKNLYKGTDSAGSISVEYLSESMFDGLTFERKSLVISILDALTGSGGLRNILTIDEIIRYTGIDKNEAQQLIEHLISRKIVHAGVEADSVNGYELVHDFLSKKFFEKLGTEEKEAKTTKEIFRKAFQEWSKHGILASKNSLEILSNNINQLTLNDEEWKFLIKSSLTIFWFGEENKFIDFIEKDKLVKICLELINDENEGIATNAIRTLGRLKDNKFAPILINIIESSEKTAPIRQAAIDQFWFSLRDVKILDPLKIIIQNAREYKLRKSAVYAFATNLQELSKHDETIVDKQIDIIYEALDDSNALVRREAADVLRYILISRKSVGPLINKLKNEFSFSCRKAIVIALGSLLKKNESVKIITSILKKVATDNKEDYRVREEANRSLTEIGVNIR